MHVIIENIRMSLYSQASLATALQMLQQTKRINQNLSKCCDSFVDVFESQNEGIRLHSQS